MIWCAEGVPSRAEEPNLCAEEPNLCAEKPNLCAEGSPLRAEEENRRAEAVPGCAERVPWRAETISFRAEADFLSAERLPNERKLNQSEMINSSRKPKFFWRNWPSLFCERYNDRLCSCLHCLQFQKYL